jgi:hypothetical protein
MPSAGYLFLLCALTFVILAWLFSYERARGRRVFLAGFRNRLDDAFEQITLVLAAKLNYLGRHIIKLSWYYGIHKTLRFILAALVKSYDYLEGFFMRNRERARTIKLEKRTMQSEGHLVQVAEHKASTALTDSQKKRLLQKKLERG